MVPVAADCIGQAVVQDVCHDKKVDAADRIIEDSFGFPGPETGAGAADDVGVLVVALKIGSSLELLVGRFTEPDQIVIHPAGQIETSFQGRDLQRRDGKDIFIRSNIRHRTLLSFVYILSHVSPAFEIRIKV